MTEMLKQESLLLKINQAVLSEENMGRYIFLQEKMEVVSLSDSEYYELLNLINQEEKIRNIRFQYLLELSQFLSISLTELMNRLGLNGTVHA
jgi:DNA-binding Xre family transcriptional regulator